MQTEKNISSGRGGVGNGLGCRAVCRDVGWWRRGGKAPAGDAMGFEFTRIILEGQLGGGGQEWRTRGVARCCPLSALKKTTDEKYLMRRVAA